MTEILSWRRLTKILPLIYEIDRLFEKKAKKKVSDAQCLHESST